MYNICYKIIYIVTYFMLDSPINMILGYYNQGHDR